MKKKHDIDEVKRKKLFECPFTCGIPAFHTMMELLKHCENTHEHSLGNQTHLSIKDHLLLNCQPRQVKNMLNLAA